MPLVYISRVFQLFLISPVFIITETPLSFPLPSQPGPVHRLLCLRPLRLPQPSPRAGRALRKDRKGQEKMFW